MVTRRSVLDTATEGLGQEPEMFRLAAEHRSWPPCRQRLMVLQVVEGASYCARDQGQGPRPQPGGRGLQSPVVLQEEAAPGPRAAGR